MIASIRRVCTIFAPVVNSRAREIFPDLIGVVVLENHDPLASADRTVHFGSEPFDLLGSRIPTGRDSCVLSRMNRNPFNVIGTKRLANVTAKSAALSVVLDIVIADHRKLWHLEAATDVVEKLPLLFGRILDIVPDELNEIGPYQGVGLVDNPAGGLDVFEAGLRQMQVPGHDDDNRFVESFMVFRSPETRQRF